MVGRILGQYEILEKLGQGGMGSVWKARHTRLNRLVALKLLPPEMVAQPEWLHRFVQEAQAASALNHPGIVTIYDCDEDNGQYFIAMELVRGMTVGEFGGGRPLRLRDALEYAVQIAAAMSAAHAAGIVHRDLKPANIMVSDGQVKILDFGLAKQLPESSDKDDPERTLTRLAHTQYGTIVGSAPYVSPEQAEGREVDARSDIFSFGSVLYEMTTGRRAFQGDSNISTLGAILHKEPPPPSQINPDLPREVERVILRCLQKDLAKRAQNMHDLLLTLEQLKDECASGTLSTVQLSAASPRRRWPWRSIVWGIVPLALVVVGGLLWKQLRPAAPPEASYTPVPLTSYEGEEEFPTFSPDGSQVAYSHSDELRDQRSQVFVKVVGSEPPLQVTSGNGAARMPRWSPDGRWIAYRYIGPKVPELRIVAPVGGSPRTIAELPTDAREVCGWTPDSTAILIGDRSPNGGLTLYPVDGGERRRITNPVAPLVDWAGAISPDGQTLVLSRCNWPGTCELWVQPLGSGYAPSGEPRLLKRLHQVIYALAWTADGKSVLATYYDAASPGSSIWRIPTSANPSLRRLDFAGLGISFAAASLQGNRLAYSRSTEVLDIWQADASGTLRRSDLSSTFEDKNPQFSPDGERVAFESNRSGIEQVWVCAASGSNCNQLSFHPQTCGSPRWSPDAATIVYDCQQERGPRDVFSIPSVGGRATQLTTHAASDNMPVFSVDGRWIYFSSNRSGRAEIYRMPAGGAAPEEKTEQVSRDGGERMIPSADGYLYYTKAGQAPLFRRKAAGGAEEVVLESISHRGFFPVADGLYYITRPARSPILRFRSTTGQTRDIAVLPHAVTYGLAVSPDRKTILYSAVPQRGSDLMLVENYR